MDMMPVGHSYTSQLPIVDSRETLEEAMAMVSGMRPCPGFACTNDVVTFHWGDWTRLELKCQVEGHGQGSHTGITDDKPVRARHCFVQMRRNYPIARSDTRCCDECQALQKQLDEYEPLWLRMPKDLSQRF